MQTAFSTSTEQVLVLLLLQLALIVAAARLSGLLFRRLHQSQSMGEIFGGVMLGPSLIGHFFPGFLRVAFPAAGPQIIPYLSHIGLVLALFLIGASFEFAHVRAHGARVVTVALASLVAPMLAGMALAPTLYARLPGSSGLEAYALFIGLVMAITAIPIMGRVLLEQGLGERRVALLGIATGAVKDLFTWFLLMVVIGVARPPLDWLHVGRVVLLTCALGALCVTLGPRLLDVAVARGALVGDRPGPALLAALLVALFLLAAATSALGIYAIFGAFLAGVVVSLRPRVASAVVPRLHDLVVLLFLPIFFTYTGLRCDLSALTFADLGLLALVTLVGSLACGGVAAIAARVMGLTAVESVAMGALINTPGLMVLILLNIGLDVGVLPKALFSILVGSAMLRNLAVTPVLVWARRRGLPAVREEPAGSRQSLREM